LPPRLACGRQHRPLSDDALVALVNTMIASRTEPFSSNASAQVSAAISHADRPSPIERAMTASARLERPGRALAVLSTRRICSAERIAAEPVEPRGRPLLRLIRDRWFYRPLGLSLRLGGSGSGPEQLVHLAVSCCRDQRFDDRGELLLRPDDDALYRRPLVCPNRTVIGAGRCSAGQTFAKKIRRELRFSLPLSCQA